MRTKATRKWVDKMERAARSANTVDGEDSEGVSKKRKLSATGDVPEIKLEDSIEATGFGDNITFAESIDMSVVHGASEIGRPRDASAAFPYMPLDNSKLEIRVVTLQPGHKTAPIECSLQHVATDKGSRPLYKALSYAWGSPELQKTILLDGIQVQIRENLWQALFHLRAGGTPLFLWIDALCINQGDIPERNQQVSRMGTLYGLAEEVVVWLGPERNGSKQALEFLLKSMGSRAGALPADFASSLSSRPEMLGIKSLTERDYWSRAWIIQEIFRARKLYIHCGYERMPWTHLAKFVRHVERQLEDDATLQAQNLVFLRESLMARLTKHRTAQNRNLESLLRTYKSSLCMDPRDKVYSLLGLAGRQISASAVKKPRPQWISVDYSKSAQELFESLALLYYREGALPDQFASYPSDTSFLSATPLSYITEESKYRQVQRMQLLQEILGIEPSANEHHRSLSSPAISAEKITCTTGYKARVSQVFKYKNNVTGRKEIMHWYARFLGPDMPSALALETTLNVLNEEDLARLRTYKPRYQLEGNESHITAQSSAGATLFTTHNGRIGLTCCYISGGDYVVRFPACDVAVVTGPNVKGRAFIVKSDRRPSRGLELSSTEAAAFRYATPDVQDDEMYDYMHADTDSSGGVYVNKGLRRSEPHTSATLTLQEWQMLTW